MAGIITEGIFRLELSGMVFVINHISNNMIVRNGDNSHFVQKWKINPIS